MGSPKIQHGLEIKFGSEYGPEEEQAAIKVIRQGAPTSGEACIQFEKNFAEYCGAKYARAVTNGTAALFLSMVGLGIKPGDHVITTPMTWIATAAAPATLGAEIDFVDIDPHTYNLDPRHLAAAITPHTKAIIPVHLYGQLLRHGSDSRNCQPTRNCGCGGCLPGCRQPVQEPQDRVDGSRRLL